MSKVTNVVVAGLGGQGVLKASDIIADVVFAAGLDVKKSEIHGMSQRGGSVCSDVRYGEHVFSPMVPRGAADFLVVLSTDQVEVNAEALSGCGVLIEPSQVDESKLRNRKSINIALLGVLSRYLKFSDEQWFAALERNLPETLLQTNIEAFKVGRGAAATV
ncbi:MAG TPA: 2-oxoacid:acceptor oxidoreductase family protein [Terriglobales bacterium]|nr:2-oxoacid:acceptor oxidoreductase family protein [Terriglobales bacterium]